MSKSSQLLYRFRGFILGAFALALLVTPAAPFPWDLAGSTIQHKHFVIACDIFAVVLFLAGIVLRIKSRQYIGEHTRGSTHQADALVTWGPYALMRHPLYYSNICIAVAFIFIHLGPSRLLPIFLLAVGLFESALSRIEDHFLHEKFGEEWETWAKEVPALNLGLNLLSKRKRAKIMSNFFAKKPVRTVWQSFCADRSTWAWLMFYNLLLVLKKIYLV